MKQLYYFQLTMLSAKLSPVIYFYLIILFSLVFILLRSIPQPNLTLVFQVIPHFQYLFLILALLLNEYLFKAIHFVINDRLSCLTIIHYYCHSKHDLTSFLQLQEPPFFFSCFLNISLYVFCDSISIFAVLLCNSFYYHNKGLQFYQDMK